MKNKTARRHFTTLIRFMQKLPASANKHFQMDWWFQHSRPHHHPQLKVDKVLTRRDLTLCGTTACALGWATVCPSLHKAGLTMTLDGDVRLNGRGRLGNVEVAMRFFGLHESHAVELFCRSGASTPKQWARQARGVLEEMDA